jgi:Putative transposase
MRTIGEAARFRPHVHALCSRGWNDARQWVPVPYLDHRCAEELFRHRVFRLLKRAHLLSDERIELLLSWKRSGFNIDDSVRIPAGEGKTLEHVARYMLRLRSPVCLSRMQWSPTSSHVLYAPKSFPRAGGAFPAPRKNRRSQVLGHKFLARVITQIPEPRRHLLFYYGLYANVVRGRRKISQPREEKVSSPNEPQEQDEPTMSPARKQALRRRWSDLIRRVFELDPLRCPCGGSFRVVSFITQPQVIRKIVEHLKNKASQAASELLLSRPHSSTSTSSP